MSDVVLLRGKGGRFLPGNGSKGRPKGSRNKLAEYFLQDLQHDWRQHGPAVLARVRQEDPSTYLKVIAALAAHLTPRAAPQEPPLLEGPGALPLPWSFPGPPPPNPPPAPDMDSAADPRLAELVAALQALEPRSPADCTDAELVARWGEDLARYYFERIRVPRDART